MLKRFPQFIFLLLIPLLFLNIKDSHDWGDDFAQYLIQTVNIVDGQPQTQNNLVFDESAGKFAVQAYPVGLPLILSPVYATSGLKIKSFLILISFLLIILSWLCWNYYRKFFNSWLALLMMLFFCYHSFTLDLKSQILSEIPFTICLLLVFGRDYTTNRTGKYFVISGILIACAMSIRISGILLLPALITHILFSNRREINKSLVPKFRSLLIIIVVSCAGFFFLNSLVFNISLSEFLLFYSDAGKENPINLLSNLNAYLNACVNIFRLPHMDGIWWKIVLSIILLYGFIRIFKTGKSIAAWYFLFYMLMLGIYPYSSGGFRFLFPVFPLLILFFAEGVRSIFRFFPEKVNTVLSYLIVILLLYPQIDILKETWKQRKQMVQGPQQVESVEMFDYIRNNTKPDAVIVFPRARAMTLYGERPTTYLLRKYNEDENHRLFKKLQVKYLVLPRSGERSPLYDSRLWDYFQKHQDEFELSWENSEFMVYRMIRA